MTLKEEFEILRGEPIQVFDGDPIDIPCVETSDLEKLCKSPVVSVNMITYNHEPYIRQAIEGVMTQKTDFEFELIIGEDCSQDKTREICFEYQKKYPDKIRVLWWHENVSKLGGNSRRVRARSRGEFIALCEGDDYWIDPLKLQKQVDIMRKHPNVGFCFARARIHIVGNNDDRIWNESETYYPGVVSGEEFMLKHLYGVRFEEGCWPSSTFLMTASVLFRKSVWQTALSEYEIFNWKLSLGDTTLWLGLASVADAYYLPDIVSIYNQLTTGLCRTISPQILRDALIVRMFYHCVRYNRPFNDLPNEMLAGAYFKLLIDNNNISRVKSYREHLNMVMRMPRLSKIVMSRQFLIITMALWAFNRPKRLFVGRYITYFVELKADPKWIVEEYSKCGAVYRYGSHCRFLKRFYVGVVEKLRRIRGS